MLYASLYAYHHFLFYFFPFYFHGGRDFLLVTIKRGERERKKVHIEKDRPAEIKDTKNDTRIERDSYKKKGREREKKKKESCTDRETERNSKEGEKEKVSR